MSTSIAAVIVAVSLLNNSVVELAPPPLSEHVTIVAMFNEMNAQRVRAGLPEMQLDEELCVVSQRWSNRMAKTGSFNHGGGENVIAMGQRTPKEAISAWLRSSGPSAPFSWDVANALALAPARTGRYVVLERHLSIVAIAGESFEERSGARASSERPAFAWALRLNSHESRCVIFPSR